MRKFLIIILIFIVTSSAAKLNIAAYPQFSYSDETGFMGGLIGFMRFQFAGYPTHIPEQDLTAQILYSARNQFNLALVPIYYAKNGDYQVQAELDYRYWPSEFYGIGNNDYDKESEGFTPQKISCDLQLKYRIWKRLYFLASGEFYNSKLLKTEEDGVLQSGLIPGSKKFRLMGFGSGFQFDTRSSTSYPISGELIKFAFKGYNEVFGSDHNYMQFHFVASKYFSLDSKQVLAFTSKMIYTDTIAPFQKLPHLGEEVRAYPDEIFIDQKIYAMRAEYRVFPWSFGFLRKIGFALFFDAGQIAPQIKDLAMSEFHCSFGAGFRYSVFVEDRFNVRLDVGFCKENSSFEVGGGEAF